MLKKLIITVLLCVSTLSAAKVGESSGKIMDKAYFDFDLGDGKFMYQYLGYHSNGFEVNSRTLLKVYNSVIESKQDEKGPRVKIMISGKIEIPNKYSESILLELNQAPYLGLSGRFSGRSKSKFRSMNNHFMDRYENGRMYQVYINNKRIEKKRNNVKIKKDMFNNNYIDLRIDIQVHGRDMDYFVKDFTEILREISPMTFYMEDTSSVKRGSMQASLIPLRIYSLEE